MPVVLNKVVTSSKHRPHPQKSHQSSTYSHRKGLSKAEEDRIRKYEESQRLNAWYEPYVDVPLHTILTLVVVAVVLIALSRVSPNESSK